MANGPTENNLVAYTLTVNTLTGASVVTGVASTSVSAVDTGSGADDLTVIGDNNIAGHHDNFNLTLGSNTILAYYYGVATINGVTGFVANTADNGSGTWYFVAPSSSPALTTGNSGTTTFDTLGTATPGANWNVQTGAPLCFLAGTRITTPSGEATVETLQPGSLVLTTDGRAHPVRWLGRQTVSRLFADPMKTIPVRIRQGAFGEGLPRCDLLVSPGHAFLLDGVLAEAGALANGVSIVREFNTPAIFTYYHIELADHALILAEGAAAETFVDNADRMAFENWEERQRLGALATAEMDTPRVKSSRQLPYALRARLAEVAEAFTSAAA